MRRALLLCLVGLCIAQWRWEPPLVFDNRVDNIAANDSGYIMIADYEIDGRVMLLSPELEVVRDTVLGDSEFGQPVPAKGKMEFYGHVSDELGIDCFSYFDGETGFVGQSIPSYFYLPPKINSNLFVDSKNVLWIFSAEYRLSNCWWDVFHLFSPDSGFFFSQELHPYSFYGSDSSHVSNAFVTLFPSEDETGRISILQQSLLVTTTITTVCDYFRFTIADYHDISWEYLVSLDFDSLDYSYLAALEDFIVYEGDTYAYHRPVGLPYPPLRGACRLSFDGGFNIEYFNGLGGIDPIGYLYYEPDLDALYFYKAVYDDESGYGGIVRYLFDGESIDFPQYMIPEDTTSTLGLWRVVNNWDGKVWFSMLQHLYPLTPGSIRRYVLSPFVQMCAGPTEYYGIHRGWNLLSLPFDTPHEVHTAFGDCAVDLYYFNRETGGYDSSDTLKPFEGFWLLSDRDTLVEVPASNRYYSLIDTLYPGWNLIGSSTYPTYTGDLADVYIPPIYSFDTRTGSYTEADEIVQGHGYWMLVRDSVVVRFPE